jgi:colanic acid/amylovoran biosynthesis glycosyltransferase
MEKVAYIMSRFPKLTETFILYEILALEKKGIEVEIFPLLREQTKTIHKEAQELTEHAHFHPFISSKILAAHWCFIRRDFRTYFRTIAEVFSGTFGSLNFFIGALGILPKTVRFAYEMEQLGVQHVHAHFATHPAVAGLIIYRLTGIPFSFTAHGSDLHVEKRMLDKKIRAAKFVTTVSFFNQKLMVKEGGEETREKIHVLRCGVDTKLFSPCEIKDQGRSFQILCVASFEEVKGHKYLIDACKILSEQGLDFECHFVGYGPLRKQVENQVVELGLKDKFHLHGGLPRNMVLEMLAKSDVFVLASVPTRQGKREGIPVVLMEAMASGLPVISSQLSGIPELVDNGISGILIEPGDTEALARALVDLAADSAKNISFGLAGREKVLNEFDLEKNTLKLLDLFKTY